MFDRDKEINEAYKHIKKWSKRWTSRSARKHYTGYASMKRPAQVTYDFILELPDKEMNDNGKIVKVSAEDKLNAIYEYMELKINEELSKGDEYNSDFSFYRDIMETIDRHWECIDNERPCVINPVGG
ncbi:hypothetical protein ACI2JA_03925 [Alkalihalobacillus sp. NPDC078783]